MYTKTLQEPSLILSPKDSKILRAPVKGQFYISEAPSHDLHSSLAYWKDEFNISKIVCLMEDYQLTSWCDIDPQEYAEVAASKDMKFIRYPIPDLGIPDDGSKFRTFLKSEIVSILKSRPCNILVHCYGGHGRSGLIAGCVLAELSILKDTKQIVNLIRQRRDMWCVQTREQQDFIQKYLRRL